MRRRWWGLGAVFALAATAGGVAVLSRAPDPAAPAGPAAAQSCAEVQRFLDVVAQNGPAADALQALDRAVDRARTAAGDGPTWIALSGGVESLRVAVRSDDRQAARVGVDVVRAECRRAEVVLR